MSQGAAFMVKRFCQGRIIIELVAETLILSASMLSYWHKWELRFYCSIVSPVSNSASPVNIFFSDVLWSEVIDKHICRQWLEPLWLSHWVYSFVVFSGYLDGCTLLSELHSMCCTWQMLLNLCLEKEWTLENFSTLEGATSIWWRILSISCD